MVVPRTAGIGRTVIVASQADRARCRPALKRLPRPTIRPTASSVSAAHQRRQRRGRTERLLPFRPRYGELADRVPECSTRWSPVAGRWLDLSRSRQAVGVARGSTSQPRRHRLLFRRHALHSRRPSQSVGGQVAVDDGGCAASDPFVRFSASAAGRVAGCQPAGLASVAHQQ